jgi:nucleoid DNA-binding protein
MNTKEIVAYVAKQCNYSTRKTRKVVDTLFDTILASLHQGEGVTFKNFGSFDLKEVQEKRSYNPQKKVYFTLPKRTKVKFLASKKMKDIIKNIEVK